MRRVCRIPNNYEPAVGEPDEPESQAHHRSWAGVAAHRVVAREEDRIGRGQMVEQDAGQRAAQFETGPPGWGMNRV